MKLNVVSFFKAVPRRRDWTVQELAEFYRVEEALVRTGLGVQTDRGISDEGDPWFIFCHGDSGDIVVHFARFDGCYVVASPAFDQCMYGENFRTLIQTLIDSHPVILSNSKAVGAKIFIHPAALLAALVMTCFFKLTRSQAFAGEASVSNAQRYLLGDIRNSDAPGDGPIAIDDHQHQKFVAAIALVVACASVESLANHLFPVLEGIDAHYAEVSAYKDPGDEAHKTNHSVNAFFDHLSLFSARNPSAVANAAGAATFASEFHDSGQGPRIDWHQAGGVANVNFGILSEQATPVLTHGSSVVYHHDRLASGFPGTERGNSQLHSVLSVSSHSSSSSTSSIHSALSASVVAANDGPSATSTHSVTPIDHAALSNSIASPSNGLSSPFESASPAPAISTDSAASTSGAAQVDPGASLTAAASTTSVLAQSDPGAPLTSTAATDSGTSPVATISTDSTAPVAGGSSLPVLSADSFQALPPSAGASQTSSSATKASRSPLICG